MNLGRAGLVCAALALTSQAVASDYFEVRVKRVAANLYEVEDEGIFIRTQFCFTFTFGEEAVVRIDGFDGMTIGKIAFKESGDVCDVVKLLR